MSQKKKGFTLIEVLVVMLVATLVFTMVGGVMVFVTTSAGEFIDQAEEIEMARNIEKYLRQNHDLEMNANGDLINTNGEIVFADTGLKSFDVTNGDFRKCQMVFYSGREFEFIIDVIE